MTRRNGRDRGGFARVILSLDSGNPNTAVVRGEEVKSTPIDNEISAS